MSDGLKLSRSEYRKQFLKSLLLTTVMGVMLFSIFLRKSELSEAFLMVQPLIFVMIGGSLQYYLTVSLAKRNQEIER